ncbi:GIY-YIG nuclease family protein [Cnuella takakiae]|nr:GIY-YIG nuclease family protein [Cnuella takakiae]OLY94167.1 hypothetical protein BUE76_21465 [Cnuella takakiae]
MLRPVEPYAVYIMGNAHGTTFYIGITGNLHQRIWQHKTGHYGGFTHKYNCHHLLYFETYTDVKQAIAREKNLKNWRRDWKINLVKQKNPELRDLAAGWYAKN